jgi:serine/threonine-protein kinase RsbT
MAEHHDETLLLRNSDDIVNVRQRVRHHATNAGFSLVDQTKLITAASELARNTVIYGGGGVVRISVLNQSKGRGVRLVFKDEGPGIKDIDQAMKDGFTTGSGLGMGLGGARRLSNEFEITSEPGKGTTISIVRWK